MLKQLDRIQLAVPDASAAAETFSSLFGAMKVGEGELPHMRARRTTMALGDIEVDLLQPAGTGAVDMFVNIWGGGLFGVGFSTDDPADIMQRIIANTVPFTMMGDRIYTEPLEPGGIRIVVSPTPEESRPRVGLLSHVYEVTNPVDDLEATVDYYTTIFGLDPEKFAPIASDQYGYTGTLTLFDPPDRLDRFEVTGITDPKGAMGRFHEKRGDSLYMCFAEVDDFDALCSSLERAEARYTLDDAQPDGKPDVLFIHPQSLHGMLMGISLSGVAWRWSSGGGYH